MDCIVHGILQARILEWVAFHFSRWSSQPRDWTQISLIAADSFPAEPQGKPNAYPFSSRSSRSSWSRNWTEVSCIAAGFFTRWATREAHTHNRACKHLLTWLNWGMLYWEGGPWVLLETERGLWMVTDCPFMSHLSWTLRRIWKAKTEWRRTLRGMSTAELMVSLTTRGQGGGLPRCFGA